MDFKYFLTPSFRAAYASFALLLVLLVHVDDALDLLLAAEENTAPVVDVLGHNLHHALHLAVDCETTGCVR